MVVWTENWSCEDLHRRNLHFLRNSKARSCILEASWNSDCQILGLGLPLPIVELLAEDLGSVEREVVRPELDI